jgi:hypothetical protein
LQEPWKESSDAFDFAVLSCRTQRTHGPRMATLGVALFLYRLLSTQFEDCVDRQVQHSTAGLHRCAALLTASNIGRGTAAAAWDTHSSNSHYRSGSKMLSRHWSVRAGTASSGRAADRSYLFATALRDGYVTEGQCCSGTHFPCTCTAPTKAPQSPQGWTAHCSRFLFRVRTSCKSSLNRPSHGFTDKGIILLFTMLDAASLGILRILSQEALTSFPPDAVHSCRVSLLQKIATRSAPTLHTCGRVTAE